MVLPNPLKTPTAIAAGFGGRRWSGSAARAEGAASLPREAIEAFAAARDQGDRPTGAASPTAAADRRSGSPLARHAGPDRRDLRRRRRARRSARPRSQTGADGTFLPASRPGPAARSGRLRRQPDPDPRQRRRGAARGAAAACACAPPRRRPRIGGAPVVFRGRVGDLGARSRRRQAGRAPVPPPRQPWTEFRTVQTDARGRFRYPYSLQRRRQPRRPLPVPRLRPGAGRLALRAGRLAAGLRERPLSHRPAQECSGPSDAFTKRAPHAGCMRGSLRGRSAPRPVRSLPESCELISDLLDESPSADALLDLGAVALQGRLDRALALAGLALDPVAGLAGLGGRLAAGGGAATLGALQGSAQLRCGRP